MKEFRDCLSSIAVYDHSFNVPLFSWSNNQQEGFVARKIDRALINGLWPSVFPGSTVDFLSPEISDHCAILVRLKAQVCSKPKPFKFFNCWIQYLNFLKVVEDSWSLPVANNIDPMNSLFLKLKRLKLVFKQFNRDKFGNLSGKVHDKRTELADLQNKILSSTNPTVLITKEITIKAELQNLLLAEESFYKQKARNDWINLGDQNTKFFQQMVAAQYNRTMIKSLVDEHGSKVDDYDVLCDMIVSYF
ncbi:hypothetical protein PTKIN_Ptkin13bG0216700 [Pterospermum kingtungense]